LGFNTRNILNCLLTQLSLSTWSCIAAGF